ncbi:hypothetical protein GW17_00028862 [Ensete ventricosum]|nr:hypothetical protein GW17_00028862 [Ensete ventricosum]
MLTSPNYREDNPHFAAGTTNDEVRCGGTVSNKKDKGLMYERPANRCYKGPCASTEQGDRKFDNQTNLTVGEVTSGTPPDLTFLQDSAVNPSSTTPAANLPSRT